MSKQTINNVKSLYDLKSFTDKAAYASSTFKDAGGIILARNLEHVSEEIFTQEYAGLTFLNSGIVVNNEGGYATSIKKLKLKVQGAFRESGSATDTNGKITLAGEDDTIPVFTKDAESDWTEIELKQAELQNVNLASRFLEGHAELYQRDIDTIGYLGQVRTDGSQKTTGLLTHGFTATAASGTALALSGDVVYSEVAALIVAQWGGVSNVETYKADQVIFPASVYNTLATKIMNSAGSEMSVLSALKANFPTVTFGLTTKAESISGTSRTVAFSSNRRAMQMRIPLPLNISSVDQRGFKYYVESFFGVAGLDVIESTAGRFLTGL